MMVYVDAANQHYLLHGGWLYFHFRECCEAAQTVFMENALPVAAVGKGSVIPTHYGHLYISSVG